MTPCHVGSEPLWCTFLDWNSFCRSAHFSLINSLEIAHHKVASKPTTNVLTHNLVGEMLISCKNDGVNNIGFKEGPMEEVKRWFFTSSQENFSLALFIRHSSSCTRRTNAGVTNQWWMMKIALVVPICSWVLAHCHHQPQSQNGKIQWYLSSMNDQKQHFVQHYGWNTGYW